MITFCVVTSVAFWLLLGLGGYLAFDWARHT
jgi:hypothetical protein